MSAKNRQLKQTLSVKNRHMKQNLSVENASAATEDEDLEMDDVVNVNVPKIINIWWCINTSENEDL